MIKDHHEAYISWEEYERNQRLISDNANGKSYLGRGSVRRGGALLPGLFRCARCGRKLQVSYGGKQSYSQRYACRGAFSERAELSCISFGAWEPEQVQVRLHLIRIRMAAAWRSRDRGRPQARIIDRMSAGVARKGHSVLLCSLHRRVLLIAALVFVACSYTVSWAAVPQGVWLMDARVAVQIYSCAGLLCGRILWLQIPRDPQGQLDRDKHNPDPALRQRPLCGLTILWNLHPAGPQRWSGGWFYNPENGTTYNVSAQLKSADVLIARIYLGFPLFGETKTLTRVPHGTSKGWC